MLKRGRIYNDLTRIQMHIMPNLAALGYIVTANFPLISGLRGLITADSGIHRRGTGENEPVKCS